uniref:cGMP-dependent protein kinase 1-like n=1 Tax=Seriola lalandi dorsalis TaxID=1841481 RepID=A0A3B4WA12_SERLL
MGTLRDLQFALQLKIEELRQRDTLIDELELELDTKDELIRRLQEELDRYRATVSLPGPSAVSAGTEHAAFICHVLEFRAKRLIQAAFLKNELLKNHDEGEIRAIIACMYPTTINQGCYVIQEGTSGAQAYVLEEGRLEVTKDGRKLLTIEPQDMFGELALLYNCIHTYSVSAQTDSKLWVIDSKSYQTILMQSGLNKSWFFYFLSFHPLPLFTHYNEGDYIIRQGATGDTFYIISKGQVKFCALCLEDVQTVNVVAAVDVFRSDKDCAVLSSSTLSDFNIICTLAPGEFGHVDLVQLKSNIKCLFAMKVLKKKLILNNGQQEHVLREGRILMEAYCPFIVRLHKIFRDPECLYILTEACLGGDLCSLLKDKGYLDECSTRFYIACVVEALTFLHGRGVIYRDIKPENIVLDEHGYAKLVFTIKVEVGKKTWTFCGTLGYIAPEIILNKGHSVSTDFWSLGVFLFELLSGGLPFSGSDPLKILTATICGIDQIDFPKNISKSASSLIKKLCRSNPSERLGSLRNGAKDIQMHKWFEGFNWDGLCKRTLNPPVIPKVRNLKFGLLLLLGYHFCNNSMRGCITFFPVSLSFRLIILWTAVHVVITLRTQWSCAQTGMISELSAVSWGTILHHFQV